MSRLQVCRFGLKIDANRQTTGEGERQSRAALLCIFLLFLRRSKSADQRLPNVARQQAYVCAIGAAQQLENWLFRQRRGSSRQSCLAEMRGLPSAARVSRVLTRARLGLLINQQQAVSSSGPTRARLDCEETVRSAGNSRCATGMLRNCLSCLCLPGFQARSQLASRDCECYTFASCRAL